MICCATRSGFLMNSSVGVRHPRHCARHIHRVLSPPLGSTSPRYSIPFFHNIGLDVKVTDPAYLLKCASPDPTPVFSLTCTPIVPEEILKLRDARGKLPATDCLSLIPQASWLMYCSDCFLSAVNFPEFSTQTSGHVNLVGRVKFVHLILFIILSSANPYFRSHPDVGERHYPALFKQIFPNGLPAHGTAY